MSDYQICSYCGEKISPNAKACPSCGSDERTGWSDETYMDGIDYDFEDQYEEIKEKEFSKKDPAVSWQLITGAVLLIVVIIVFLFSNF